MTHEKGEGREINRIDREEKKRRAQLNREAALFSRSEQRDPKKRHKPKGQLRERRGKKTNRTEPSSIFSKGIRHKKKRKKHNRPN